MDPLVKCAIEMRHLSAASNETIQIDFHRQRSSMVINTGNASLAFPWMFSLFQKDFLYKIFHFDILPCCFIAPNSTIFFVTRAEVYIYFVTLL